MDVYELDFANEYRDYNTVLNGISDFALLQRD